MMRFQLHVLLMLVAAGPGAANAISPEWKKAHAAVSRGDLPAVQKLLAPVDYGAYDAGVSKEARNVSMIAAHIQTQLDAGLQTELRARDLMNFLAQPAHKKLKVLLLL